MVRTDRVETWVTLTTALVVGYVECILRSRRELVAIETELQ